MSGEADPKGSRKPSAEAFRKIAHAAADILGSPTDETSYSSGKAWIPFYFGNDVRRTSYYYKGVGRVVFADGNAFGGGASEVVRVDYDPAESGVAR